MPQTFLEFYKDSIQYGTRVVRLGQAHPRPRRTKAFSGIQKVTRRAWECVMGGVPSSDDSEVEAMANLLRLFFQYKRRGSGQRRSL